VYFYLTLLLDSKIEASILKDEINQKVGNTTKEKLNELLKITRNTTIYGAVLTVTVLEFFSIITYGTSVLAFFGELLKVLNSAGYGDRGLEFD
jgi:hypothetical protein